MNLPVICQVESFSYSSGSMFSELIKTSTYRAPVTNGAILHEEAQATVSSDDLTVPDPGLPAEDLIRLLWATKGPQREIVLIDSKRGTSEHIPVKDAREAVARALQSSGEEITFSCAEHPDHARKGPGARGSRALWLDIDLSVKRPMHW